MGAVAGAVESTSANDGRDVLLLDVYGTSYRLHHVQHHSAVYASFLAVAALLHLDILRHSHT